MLSHVIIIMADYTKLRRISKISRPDYVTNFNYNYVTVNSVYRTFFFISYIVSNNELEFDVIEIK